MPDTFGLWEIHREINSAIDQLLQSLHYSLSFHTTLLSAVLTLWHTIPALRIFLESGKTLPILCHLAHFCSFCKSQTDIMSFSWAPTGTVPLKSSDSITGFLTAIWAPCKQALTGSSHLCINSISTVSGTQWCSFIGRGRPGPSGLAVLNAHHLCSSKAHKVVPPWGWEEGSKGQWKFTQNSILTSTHPGLGRAGRNAECKDLHPARSSQHLLQWVEDH